MTVHVHRLDDDTVAIDIGDVEREPHAEGVHPPAVREHHRPFGTVAAQQPAALGATTGR